MVAVLYKVKDPYCMSATVVCCGRLLPIKVLKSYIFWRSLTYLSGSI